MDIAQEEGNRDESEERYLRALTLYEKLPQLHSIGMTHRRLARLASDEGARRDHVSAAREAWRSIGRDDLIAQLDAEFAS